MSAVSIEENKSKNVICLYRYHPQSPGDGYYELTTEQGEFLGNVDQSELSGELRSLREQGYTISNTKGGGAA